MRLSWDLQKFLQHYENDCVPIDVAWQNKLFDEIEEFAFKDIKGFQTFHSKDPYQIYLFMKEMKVVKFHPWSAFCFEDGLWDFCSEFRFKFFQKRKHKKNKIPSSSKDKPDLVHKKIKGQKSKDFY